jgi:adhesin/invasin
MQTPSLAMMHTHSRLRARATAVLALMLGTITACSDDPAAPPVAAAVVALGDVAITGVAGTNASSPLVVRVNDSNGSPVANTVVTFSVVEGGGTVTPALDTTDSQGRAQTTWRFGGTAGAQRAQATVAGVTGTVTYVATVAAAGAAAVTVQAGDNQSAAAGQVVATAPSIIVRDQFNNPVPGVAVLFTVTAGGGTVTTPGATTNAQGIATATGWRLGSTAGVNRLTAFVVANGATGNPVTFTATGTAGAATSIAAGTPTTTTVNVGALVTPLPSVRLVDANGNPVQGAAVTFTGSAGSTVLGGSTTTDANGVAAVTGFQVGTTAGTYTLTATSGTLTPLVFSVTARSTGATTLSIAAGNQQSAISGRPVDAEPAVRVTDSFGNPVAGIEVVFDVITGGGFVTARRPQTNASGIATVGGWTLGETPGTNTLRATISGPGITTQTVTFTATGTPGQPANATVQGGNAQNASAGSAVATPPSVLVRDSRGNPVAGVQVQFIVTGGGGTVAGGTATTNAQGIATATSWTLGTTTGPQTLVARIAGLPDVAFTATATAGAPASVVVLTQQLFGNVVVNQLLTPVPSVRVVDAVGNPVANATVTFVQETGGNATLTGASTTTSSTGIATLGSLRAGTVAGVTSTIRVFVQGLDQAGNEPGFTLTTVAGAPAQLQVATGSLQTQTGTASTAVTSVPSVRVTDSFGNPVAGVAVEFVPSAGSGSVTGELVTTNANGIATVGSWTMPAGSGSRTLTARLVNNPNVLVVFTANVN